jgi:hypothetical protein
MNATVRVSVSRAETLMSVSLVVQDCASCGVLFAISDDFDAHRREDGKGFFCPNGHSLIYSPSEAERLRRQLKDAKRDAEWFRVAEQAEREQRQAAERSASAFKGQATRLRNRAVTGTCAFCRRHFANVERHVAAQHPGEVAEP